VIRIGQIGPKIILAQQALVETSVTNLIEIYEAVTETDKLYVPSRCSFFTSVDTSPQSWVPEHSTPLRGPARH
jgi:hypothetical protein